MSVDEKICPKCAETIKAAAVVCKHCGFNFETGEMPGAASNPAGPTPQPSVVVIPAAATHKLRNGCLTVVGIIVALWVIGTIAGKNGGSASPPPATPAAPPVEISAQALDSEYNANEAAAQQRYGDARLLVTGLIASINLDIGNDPYLVLSGNNEFLGPQAHLGDNSKGQAASLTKGQQIKMVCTGAKYIVGTVMLSACEIQ